MSSNHDMTKIYSDFSQFSQLRLQAKQDKEKALPKVAKQFEAIFMQMILQSMRKSNAIFEKDNFMHSQAVTFYQNFLDEQLSTQISKGPEGLGLAKLLVQQLSNKPTRSRDSYPAISHYQASNKTESDFKTPLAFIKSLLPQAKQVAEKLQIDPKLLLAQAALETAWGKAIIKAPNGKSSHNLFNIKAGSDWDKQKIKVKTLEYEKNKPINKVQSFRQYQSFMESFQDYLSFLTGQSRYQQALTDSDDPKAFIHALHNAGYATDPNYADKVLAIYRSKWLQAL